MSVKPTKIPKCHLRQSADSAGNFSRHGKLGELTENIRTFALPFESKPYTFKMCFEYDSWNRMQRMTYPDGEKVSYGYNLGGMLDSIEGDKGGQAYMYVKHIAYNKYELKESVLYGNGSFTTYDYDNLMRLAHLQSFTGAAAEQMQDITYDYDAVSNITHIDNQAPALSYGIGGIYTNDYSYDNLYRLTSANGSWDNGAMTNSFDLGMSYHQNGRIAVKQLRADILDHLGNITTKDYDNLYSYPDGRNTLEQVEDRTDGCPLNTFEWDNAGNMTMHRFHDECIRKMCWDEENRLMSVSDCNYASLYQYDANGERTYKLTGQYSYQNINGRYYPYAVLDNPTLYASPYVVCTPKGYTKHYYAESERVASKIGNGCLRDLCKSLNTDADFNKEDEPENPYLKDCDEENELLFEKQERNCIYSKNVMACLESENFIAEKTLEGLYSRIECVEEGEDECYWYHPDHLGSSSWITFTDGKAVQHLHYLPWGEDFVDQRSTSWNAMHTFSSKERDVETGLSYFGARYYSSDLSIWLSVDPMADKYPSLSPYVYCANNPVKLVDPNGEEIGPITRIKTAQSYLGIPYRQENNGAPDFLRTANTELAMSYMDCSELVCRVMAADNITERTEHHTSTDLVDNILSDKSKYTESDTPQEGDIVAWKGHAGIVESYDENNQKVTVLHATRYKTRSGKMVESVVREDYDLQYYKGKNANFYRPVNENPDYVLEPVIISEPK